MLPSALTISLAGPGGNDASSPSGGLWVGRSNNTAVGFTRVQLATRAQLAKSGAPKPLVGRSTPRIAVSHLTPPATFGKAISASVFESVECSSIVAFCDQGNSRLIRPWRSS